MFERAISLVAPHVCIVCGREGTLLCKWCAAEFVDRVPERCYRCLALSQDAQVCHVCRRQSPLGNVWVRSLYGGTVRELLYILKFGRARAAATIVASLLDESLPYFPEDTVVTYVPTATRRVRVRGYDQTRCIARELARLRGLRCRRLLIRYGQTRQVGASRAERVRQAADNYGSISTPGIRSVLLVDDILTTGATLEAAAHVLKDSGIKHVYGAVFAQKQ